MNIFFCFNRGFDLVWGVWIVRFCGLLFFLANFSGPDLDGVICPVVLSNASYFEIDGVSSRPPLPNRM